MDQAKKGELRWFIWAIVFMIVAGTLLVLYINVSSITFSNGSGSETIMTIHRSKTIPAPATQKATTSTTTKTTK